MINFKLIIEPRQSLIYTTNFEEVNRIVNLDNKHQLAFNENDTLDLPTDEEVIEFIREKLDITNY